MSSKFHKLVLFSFYVAIILLFWVTLFKLESLGVFSKAKPEQVDLLLNKSDTIQRIIYPEDKIVCYYTEKWGQCFWSNLN